MPTIACGCLGLLGIAAVVLIVGFVLVLPSLPGIVAQFAGLSPRGETEAVFADATPIPTIALQNAIQPTQVTVSLGEYGTETLNTNNTLYEFTIGSGAVGEQMAVASFSEQGLLDLCRQRSPICSDNPPDPRFRNPRIDLRPGGAVVYVDVTLPELGGFTQTAGVVLQLDGTRRQFAVAGVDLGGMLYQVPPEQFGTTIEQVQMQGNQLLNQLSVEAGGGRFNLSEVQIDDSTLTLILR